MKYAYQIGDQVYTVELDKTSQGFRAHLGGETYEVKLLLSDSGELSFLIGDRPQRTFSSCGDSHLWVAAQGQTFDLRSPRAVTRRKQGQEAEAHAHAEHQVLAPMPGQVRAVQVSEGAAVEKGQTLLILEAMKMEIRIQAPRAGQVKQLSVKIGQTVERDQLLAEID